MTTRILSVIALLAILGTTTGYVVTSGRSFRVTGNSAQNSTGPVRLSREKVNRNLLPNQLRWALRELGDRLERPGNERRTMLAELQRATGSASVQLVVEFPDRLRMLVQSGPSSRVVAFDGKQATAHGAPPDSQEREFVESLVYDSAEYFFASQTRGIPIRALGSRFRGDDGLHYDIYELIDAIDVSTAKRVQRKRYYFNSDTQLLEKVRYDIERTGGLIQVEIRLADWQTSQQQRFPARITRIEDGNTVWTLVLSSAVFSPMVEDGIFSTL